MMASSLTDCVKPCLAHSVDVGSDLYCWIMSALERLVGVVWLVPQAARTRKAKIENMRTEFSLEIGKS
jgi:hypothetical protein